MPMLTVIDTPLVGSNPHTRNGRSAGGGDRSLGVPSVQCPDLFEKFSEQLFVLLSFSHYF